MARETPRSLRGEIVPCRKCGEWTVVGWDGETAALYVRLDAEPIPPEAEEVFFLNGWPTFTLIASQIWRRLAPGGHISGTLHKEHRC